MCERTHARNHAYANKSRGTYVHDVRELSNPEKNPTKSDLKQFYPEKASFIRLIVIKQPEQVHKFNKILLKISLTQKQNKEQKQTSFLIFYMANLQS